MSDNGLPPLSEAGTVENPKIVESVAAPVGDPPFLTRSGVWLAAAVLGFMLIVTVALLCMIRFSEVRTSPPEVATIERLLDSATRQYVASGEVETLKQANELVLKLESARRAQRDFWLSLSQLLLLNLLLPVLTSILGYVFGTSRAQTEA